MNHEYKPDSMVEVDSVIKKANTNRVTRVQGLMMMGIPKESVIPTTTRC